jgi:hypothetical protein
MKIAMCRPSRRMVTAHITAEAIAIDWAETTPGPFAGHHRARPEHQSPWHRKATHLARRFPRGHRPERHPPQRLLAVEDELNNRPKRIPGARRQR